METITIYWTKDRKVFSRHRVNRAFCPLSPEAFAYAMIPNHFGFEASWKGGKSLDQIALDNRRERKGID